MEDRATPRCVSIWCFPLRSFLCSRFALFWHHATLRCVVGPSVAVLAGVCVKIACTVADCGILGIHPCTPTRQQLHTPIVRRMHPTACLWYILHASDINLMHMKNRTSTAYGVYLSPPATLSFVQNGHPWPFCKRHCWQSQQCLQNCFAILGVHPCTPTRAQLHAPMVRHYPATDTSCLFSTA